jgi:hypothetical protein
MKPRRPTLHLPPGTARRRAIALPNAEEIEAQAKARRKALRERAEADLREGLRQLDEGPEL